MYVCVCVLKKEEEEKSVFKNRPSKGGTDLLPVFVRLDFIQKRQIHVVAVSEGIPHVTPRLVDM